MCCKLPHAWVEGGLYHFPRSPNSGRSCTPAGFSFVIMKGSWAKWALWGSRSSRDRDPDPRMTRDRDTPRGAPHLKVVVSDCFAFRVGPSKQKHCAPFSCSALCPNSQLSQSPGTYACDMHIHICMHFPKLSTTYLLHPIRILYCIQY